MNRIKELENIINYHRQIYYNASPDSDKNMISDQQYDAYIAELSELDPKNPHLIAIGAEPVSNWEKYTHLVDMGSLDKCQTQEEFCKWQEKYGGNNLFLTLKLDGLSVSLVYENGILTKAATRGQDGIGELITANVIKMQNVPLRLSEKVNLTVRGEIVLSKKNHQDHFPTYSNPRNAAAGIARRYDGSGCDKLDVLAHSLNLDEDNFSTQDEHFEYLKCLGFTVPPYYVLHSNQEVLDKKNEYQDGLRDSFEYELDGLVISNNSLEKQRELGSLHGRPYWSTAYKFDGVYKIGHIKNIILQVGSMGRITPVAVFEPKINLMGAEVEKASLHNFKNIKELGIGVGCQALVTRSNEVIPYVKEVISPPVNLYLPPTNCPDCNSALIENGEYLECPNTAGCANQIAGRIKNWIKELNVLEFGDTLIDRLVQTNKIVDISDLYLLKLDDLANIERMGEKSAKKCLDNLWKGSEVSLDVFLGALSIPMIGKSSIKAIMEAGCDTLEKFGQLGAEQFEEVPGIGPIKAKSLAKGLADNRDLILRLLNHGVKIKEKVIGKFNGYKIAITGSTKNKRAVLEKFITDNGGENKSSVGKGCTHLVISDINSTSSKAVTARKLGIKLVSEDDLLNFNL